MADNSRKVPLENLLGPGRDIHAITDFLEQGGDINAINEEGYSLLMIFSEKGNREVVNFLIEKGADLNIRNNDTYSEYFEGFSNVRSALMLAAEKGHFGVVELLLDAGAIIDFLEENECNDPSALTLATRGGYFNIVQLLVEKGAKIESVGEDASPLMYAAENGHYDIVAFLLEKGANVHHVGFAEYSAVALAEIEGHTEILALLKSYGAQPIAESNESAVENNTDDAGKEELAETAMEGENANDMLDNDSSARKRKGNEAELQRRPEFKRAKVEDELGVEAGVLEAEGDARKPNAPLNIIDEDSDANILAEESTLQSRTSLDTKITPPGCSFFRSPVEYIERAVTRANSPENH